MAATTASRPTNAAPANRIGISGPSGAGKTTLVDKVAGGLVDAVTLFYDRYARVGRWHPDIRQWVEDGCEPNTWGKHSGPGSRPACPARGSSDQSTREFRPVSPARYVVMEEPCGRDRDELAPWIDFVAHVDIPLDISLCRKLLREYDGLTPVGDPLVFMREYLDLRIGEVNGRQQQVAKHADLVVGGLRPADELAAEIIHTVRRVAASAR